MKILAPLIFVGLLLLGVFALFNWPALTTPASLTFVVFDVVAPLGLMLLGVLVVFVVMFTAYVLLLRTSMLVDAHRYTRELRAQQTLAEQAEASRLTGLRSDIEREFARLHEASGIRRSEIDARFDSLEQALLKSVEESNRSLAAYVGEVEDKLDRSLGLAPPGPRL